MQSCLLIMKCAFLSLLFFCQLQAQFVNWNVLDVDSFPLFVSTVTLSGQYMTIEEGDTSYREINKRVTHHDGQGKWMTRAVLFTDGDTSNDTTSYDGKTRTKRVRSANGYNPTTTTTVYNTDGTVSSVHYNPEQREAVFSEYEYDKQKRIVRYTETFAERVMVEQYFYNKLNQLIRKTTSSGAVLGKKPALDNEKLFAYGANGKCVQLLDNHYGTTGMIRVRDTVNYVYDSIDRLIVQTEIRQNGEVTASLQYSYDTTGRVMEVVWTRTERNRPGEERVTDSYSYDDHGYFISHTLDNFYKANTKTWEITYNERNLPERCVYREGDDVIFYTWTYTYR